MLLNDVVDRNYDVKINDVNNVVNYNEIIKKINYKKRIIQRQLNKIIKRIENRQDIKNGIIKDIDHLNDIENLKDYSYKDSIITSTDIPYNLMLDFHKCIELKYGYNDPMSNTIVTLISKFNESIIGKKQQHTTSSYLKYKNKEPRLDVLLKLKQIIDLIYANQDDGVVSHQLIKQAIKEELNADPRTLENYFICIKGFAEKMMNEKLGYYNRWNLRGIREAIDEKLQERDNKQDKIGRENV